MRPIIAVVLLLDVAMVLFVIFVVAFKRPPPDRAYPRWRNLAIPLLTAGWVSMKIGERYPTGTGVEIVRTFGPVLMGMAIMCVLVALRERRGLDSGSGLTEPAEREAVSDSDNDVAIGHDSAEPVVIAAVAEQHPGP